MDPTSLFGTLSRPNIKQGLSLHHPAVTAIQKMLLQGRRAQGRGGWALVAGAARAQNALQRVSEGAGGEAWVAWGKFVGLLVSVLPRGEQMGTEDEGEREEEEEEEE